MTISSTHSVVRSTANGTDVEFAFDFKLDAAGDMQIMVGTSIVSPTEYTVTIDTEEEGGYVTFDTAPAAGSIVERARIVKADQQTSYPVSGPFPAQSHERALDKLTMICQQVQRYVEEGVTFSPLAGEWGSGIDYKRYQIIIDPDTSDLYSVLIDYTSGATFAEDVAGGYLEKVVDFAVLVQAAADVEAYSNSAETAATTATEQAGIATSAATAASDDADDAATASAAAIAAAGSVAINSEYTESLTSGAVTLDCELYDVFIVTATAAMTISFSNFSQGKSIIIDITGGSNVTFSDTIKWPNSTEPDMTGDCSWYMRKRSDHIRAADAGSNYGEPV